MTKKDVVRKLQQKSAWVPGKRVKIDFGGDQGAVMLDGKNQRVSEGDGAADTTIRVSWDNWERIAAGDLDAMRAFMTGKIRVEGDMGNAMELGGVLSKMRS